MSGDGLRGEPMRGATPSCRRSRLLLLLALLWALPARAAVSPWDNPDSVGKPPPAVAPRPAAAPTRRRKPARARPSAPARPAAPHAKPPVATHTPDPARPTVERATPTTVVTPVNAREATADDEEPDTTAAPPPRRRRPAPVMATGEPTVAARPEAEDDASPPHARRVVARHKRVVVAQKADGDGDDEDDGGDDKAASGDAEEEDGDDATEIAPGLAPHLLSFDLEATMLGRSFRFDTPLQSENSFPRIGATLRLEAYPLLGFTRDFYRLLGIEMGQAAVPQVNGSTVSFPVVQSRWRVMLQYPLALATSFVIMPALGYGVSSFDLQRATPVNPSACPVGTAEACLPDITLGTFVADLTLRYALTDPAALSLTGGYLLGSSVSRDPGNIASEAAATARGYHAELGASYLVVDWLAVVAGGQLLHHGYTFNNPAVTYRSATETYYGASLGLRISTR
jgi:hypothetical protein